MRLERKFNPLDYLIFEGLAGSRLYGTHDDNSDFDTRGVCLTPLDVILDPFHNFKVADSFEGEDKQIYDLGNFIRLCADNNPNILEAIFVPIEKSLFWSDAWQRIVDNRSLFLSKNVKHRFLGYAVAQLKSIMRHKEWFTNPPEKKPTRKDYGLSESPLVSEGNIQNMMSLSNDLFLPEYRDEMRRERLYREEKKKWDNFMQWKTNRNPKRKASEEKIGYDGKMASHLFRLMSEGKELLLHGTITFPLPNADWLRDIKNGLYTYEELLDLASGLETSFQKWYDESPLPHKPNVNALKELYFEIMKDYSL